ncbi:hypothetical protein CHS0354_031426 [Potamilus streckersoni]|uniref:Homeobox domain-containing protein n=1 Tax=Potamilus streckersoni TaxID=2493646 RepID=A0AAE0RUM5_9BIVA|nr:hypothetical protein CHS0354_031426 [Potamilus streckersoni]
MERNSEPPYCSPKLHKKSQHDKMAVSVKQEVGKSSPGSSPKMVVDANDNVREKSFNAMQGLIFGEEKYLKGKDINNSFQNLMEYREAPASPSASSVTTNLSLDNPGSPNTPNSPPPEDMDDERLPNELLEEICVDIGMKEGMELDFVEFLMEQDIDPHVYMTPEAIMQANMAAGIQTTSTSHNSGMAHMPTGKSSGADMTWGCRTCGSPSYSTASSTNVTIATSSGSSSPVSKRFHMSGSGPSSPTRTNRPQSPFINNQRHVFKAPHTPPVTRKTLSASQGVASPGSNISNQSSQSGNASIHSQTSNHSNHSVKQGNQISNTNSSRCTPPPQCFSSSKTSEVTGLDSPQMPHSTTNLQQKPPPQYCQGQGDLHITPQNRASVPQKQMMPQGFQRLGRPAPPNVNVQNLQQQNKWFSQGMMGNQSCALSSPQYSGNHKFMTGSQGNSFGPRGNLNQMQNQQRGRSLDSPLDQGYYTSDTGSVRSYGSSAASTVPSSISSSLQTVVSNKHISMGQQQQNQMSTQKCVHFADLPESMHRQSAPGGLPYEPEFRTNVPDCELEEYQNTQKSMQSKIMPRLNHNMKPGSAPYTVPSNNGQVSINPYSDYSRSGNHANSIDSPRISMQHFDYSQKSKNCFSIDNNQNMSLHNFNEGIGSQANIPNCSVQSTCNGSMESMQQMETFRGQSSCQMQGMDSTKGSLYDPMAQNSFNYSKSVASMPDENCQFSNSGQGPGGYNMMGMNRDMMGHQQASLDQNYNQQNFQGLNSNQGYPIQPSSTAQCGNDSMRPMHVQEMMGYDSSYDQNRMMAGNMNMTSQGYAPNMPNMGENISMDNQNWNCQMPQAPQMKELSGQIRMPRMPNMGMHGQSAPLQGTRQCTVPNCNSCKTGSSHRPPMLASQHTFIQHLIMDKSNAFRSHPLFPLLRDLIIADINFNIPNFPYQLISHLPRDFDRLLQNYLQRNPPSGNYQTNYTVESVVMDALKYAHHCLMEKLHSMQDLDKPPKSTSKSLSAIQEFCQKFEQTSSKNLIKPATLRIDGQGSSSMHGGSVGIQQMVSGPMGIEMGTPTKESKFAMRSGMLPGDLFSPMTKKGLDFQGMISPQFKSLHDLADCASDNGSMVSSSSNHGGKTESKKHPSLPKEAVAIMLDWLRQHKDNPYPNDDEKAMLIKQTGLTINQINYWFTNARRRILPKWAQQCK